MIYKRDIFAPWHEMVEELSGFYRYGPIYGAS
jgi:hypothetical protein